MRSPRSQIAFLCAVTCVWSAFLCISLLEHSPYFRPWEILRRGLVNFVPSVDLTMDASGDLGRNAWIPELKRRRRVTFTTDAHGFRNLEEGSWSRVVVVGDSYVVSSGVDDRETLTAQLSSIIGEPVYNYGCAPKIGPFAYLCDRRSTEAPPEIVIWAPASRIVEPLFLGRPPDRGARERAQSVDVSRYAPTWVRRAAQWLAATQGKLNERNYLTTVAKYAFHGAYFRLTGEPWEIRAIGVDGETSLVMTLDAQNLCLSPEEVDWRGMVESVAEFHAILKDRGSKLLFAPIPCPGEIYPDYYPADERARLQTPPLLDLVMQGLTERGVCVVDLRPSLRNQRTPYLYLRDDTHLNGGGILVVARAISAVLEPLLARGDRLHARPRQQKAAF